MFSDRDFCFLQVNRQMSDDKFIVLCRSVEDEHVPDKQGFVRGDIWTCGYVIERCSEADAPRPESTVTYVCALDLQGLVPKFISNILLEELPMKLAGVHRLFMSGAPAPSAGAAPYPDGGSGGDAPATSRINFL